jgi:hypothetical protein
MTDTPSVEAWNNFVMNIEPSNFEAGSSYRAAAIANLYMGLATNGGINSFLTCSHEFDATEVLEALISLGALTAAKEFNLVLRGLKVPVPASSQEARWSLLEQYWPSSLDNYDVLTEQAYRDLQQSLERHVKSNEAFYLSLK